MKASTTKHDNMKHHRTIPLGAALSFLVAVPLAASPQEPLPVQRGDGCGADDAYTNVSPQLKLGYDYVPVGNDDSKRLYVAYSAKVGGGGGLGNTAGIFILPLYDNEVLIFGAGYGDPEFAPGFGALFDAETDVINVDQAIRGCMGLEPHQVIVRFVSPHGHGDHINSYFMRELRDAGYGIAEIVYHQNDNWSVTSLPGWTSADYAVMNPIGGSGCNVELYSFESPLGHIWFTLRAGHTPGAMDLVLDVDGDPTNRVLLRGSVAGGQCHQSPSGTQMRISAHGTVFFNGQVQARATVRNGSGVNPERLSSGVPPSVGHLWEAQIDTNGLSGVDLTWFLCFYTPLENGLMTPYGELLVQVPYYGGVHVFDSVGTPFADGIGRHYLPIPNDSSLLGVELFCQGVITGQGPVLTNALDLILGN